MEKDEREKQMILKEFENHTIRDHQVMFRAGSPRVEVMTFGNKNGSSNCRIDYMLRNGALAVYGDLGEAVYRWYGKTTLEWIATCNLSYFHSKCDASGEGDGWDKGMRPRSWDGVQANKEIRSHLRELIKDGSIEIDYYKETPEAKDELKNLLRSCEDKNDFESYLRTGCPELAVDDQDWWEWLPSVGNEIPIRIRMHLIGLKLAFGKSIEKYC